MNRIEEHWLESIGYRFMVHEPRGCIFDAFIIYISGIAFSFTIEL